MSSTKIIVMEAVSAGDYAKVVMNETREYAGFKSDAAATKAKAKKMKEQNGESSKKRVLWSAEEDAVLLKAHGKHGNQWQLIAETYPLLSTRLSQNIGQRFKTLTKANAKAKDTTKKGNNAATTKKGNTATTKKKNGGAGAATTKEKKDTTTNAATKKGTEAKSGGAITKREVQRKHSADVQRKLESRDIMEMDNENNVNSSTKKRKESKKKNTTKRKKQMTKKKKQLSSDSDEDYDPEDMS